MKNERAPESVAVFAYGRGFSPIFITAALSVLVLLAVAGWQLTRSDNAQNATPLFAGVASSTGAENAFASAFAGTEATSSDSAATSTLGSAVMSQLENAYLQLQTTGTNSSSSVEAAGASLVPYVSATIQYPSFSAADVRTDPDTSYTRMLAYRSDLRTSLAPLLQNKEPEFEIFAYYVETKDATYLVKLRDVAASYRAAASSTARVVVPSDAVAVQVGMLNAMEEFSATLDQMATHAQDPFASAALLENYNAAENDVISAFNDLATYSKSKTP